MLSILYSLSNTNVSVYSFEADPYIFKILKKNVLINGSNVKTFNYLIENQNTENYVDISKKYFIPNEVDYLVGDATKAKNKLGWEPTVDFNELVKIMVEHDITEAKKDLALLKDSLIFPTWEHPKEL